MQNITCPFVSVKTRKRCGEDAVVVAISVGDGEVDFACADHAEVVRSWPDVIVVPTNGPLHSTGLYTR